MNGVTSFSSFVLLNVHRSNLGLLETSNTAVGSVCVCGGGGGGGSVTYEQLIPALRPVKTKETVSHLRNNNVKEVGTPSVRSNLCTPQLAGSTAVWNSHKDSVRRRRNDVKEGISRDTTSESSSQLTSRHQGVRHYLRAQSQGHYTVDRPEERGAERGNAPRSYVTQDERRPSSIGQ